MGTRTALPLLILVGTLVAGCASTPAQVRDAANLRVSYWDFKTDASMILVNESNPEFQDLYSRPRENADTKLAADEDLRDLVEFASDNGFFEKAGNDSEPDRAIRANAHRMIVITADQKNYSLVQEIGLGARDPDAVAAFLEIQERIRLMYNNIHQLQYISTGAGGGSDYFDRERERLQRENKARLGKGNSR